MRPFFDRVSRGEIFGWRARDIGYHGRSIGVPMSIVMCDVGECFKTVFGLRENDAHGWNMFAQFSVSTRRTTQQTRSRNTVTAYFSCV